MLLEWGDFVVGFLLSFFFLNNILQYSLNLLNPKKSSTSVCFEMEVRFQLNPELGFAESQPSEVFVVFATHHHFSLFGQKLCISDN